MSCAEVCLFVQLTEYAGYADVMCTHQPLYDILTTGRVQDAPALYAILTTGRVALPDFVSLIIMRCAGF